MIAVRELTKLYGAFTAVDAVSFDVGRRRDSRSRRTERRRKNNDAPLHRGDHSRVEGNGVDRRTRSCVATAIEAKRALAFIPDEPHLFEYLSVEEHLRFIARLYGVADIDTRGPAILNEMELTEKRRALPNELSRGMRQKLAIACGLLHEPRGADPRRATDRARSRRYASDA